MFAPTEAKETLQWHIEDLSKNRCSIDSNAWEDLAFDRSARRSKVRSSVTEYEKQHISLAIKKHQQRKGEGT